MRQVLPELLDTLHPSDPVALCSRDELHIVNHLMRNHHWLCRMLREQDLAGSRILELGAGDGSLARHVWKQDIVQPERWCAIDLVPAPNPWPDHAVWHQHDLFKLTVLPEAEIIVANLFLHQFQEDQLRELGGRLPDTCRMLIVCEPARRWIHALQGVLLSAIVGLNHVTYHDMFVSIRAGFLGDELPKALGLEGWKTSITHTPLGAYRMTAWR